MARICSAARRKKKERNEDRKEWDLSRGCARVDQTAGPSSVGRDDWPEYSGFCTLKGDFFFASTRKNLEPRDKYKGSGFISRPLLILSFCSTISTNSKFDNYVPALEYASKIFVGLSEEVWFEYFTGDSREEGSWNESASRFPFHSKFARVTLGPVARSLGEQRDILLSWPRLSCAISAVSTANGLNIRRNMVSLLFVWAIHADFFIGVWLVSHSLMLGEIEKRTARRAR